MALFDKLFSLKRKLDPDYCQLRNRDRSCQISPEQVRLLLFKECDWRGRKLLFDSSVIQKVLAGKNDKPNVRQTNEVPCIVEVSNGYSYLYKGTSADASVLGEMIFGAVAMNYKSVSLKIHIMDEPRRLMCTKIFCVPTTRKIGRVDRPTGVTREGSSCSDLRNCSKPLNVPSLTEEGVSLSFSLDRGDSGFCGDNSPYSSIGSTYDYFSMFETWDGNDTQDELYFHCPPGRKLGTTSNGSLQRRTIHNMATRFDFGHNSSNLLNLPTASSNGTNSDSQIYCSSSINDSFASGGSSSYMVQKKNKLGLALLITVTDTAEMDLVRRCVEHSPQLQALVCRLRLATLTAGANGGFVSTLHSAAEDAARWLSDLVYGPRIESVWLNLVTSETRVSNKIAESLLSDLCSVLSSGDTKDTNFFFSTLLTHVLTHHLGWVSTVSPYDIVEYEKPVPESGSDLRRPYNALFAQLSDLCGSIGYPPRASRTVITGTANTQFINRLLVVLTYFLRCGDVRRNDFQFQKTVPGESKTISVQKLSCSLKRNATQVDSLGRCDSVESLSVSVNTQNCDSNVSTMVPGVGDVSIKRSSTFANLNQKLSNSSELRRLDGGSTSENLTHSHLKRIPTILNTTLVPSDSSLNSSLSDTEPEQKVVFVLGDNEKLVGLKNKSNGGKSVKKSSKVHIEPLNIEIPEKKEGCKESCVQNRNSNSPSKCCGQILQHSKPIKHSGFKFEFDKYPQIVTNYMKSKNLEILDRHYIGKPGNLKLDNFQFDPTIVPPIQEERCETCVKCQLMESMLQTPTNASEMEYMNDIPRQTEPQYATETVVRDIDQHREMSPKTFVRCRKESTVVVNILNQDSLSFASASDAKRNEGRKINGDKQKEKLVEVKQVIELSAPQLCGSCKPAATKSGFDKSLLGGITDHYVPDLILQGTIASPNTWEVDLRRDLELMSYLNKSVDTSLQAMAVVGDTNTWEVRVVGRECGSGGMSSLVGSMLDALPVMRRAKVPAHQCLAFLEGKLREFCVLSKTLADMLMSTDFCDIATLTKSLNIDVNDVPLLLAVATTHTPQVATRYGISYR